MSTTSGTAAAAGLPDATTRWIDVLFAIGSTCFLVGGLLLLPRRPAAA